MKIKSIIVASAILCSTASMGQVMVMDYIYNDPATPQNESNFNYVTEEYDGENIIVGATENRGGNYDFHITRKDINGNIIWDQLYDMSQEDYLSHIMILPNEQIAVVGTYLSTSTNMHGKVMILDGNTGALMNAVDVLVPGNDLYLLGGDYSANLDHIAVCGFVADPTGNMLTAYKEAYVLSMDINLNFNWSNSYNSGTSTTDRYNMFSKSKYVSLNGIDELYLTGSLSYPEPMAAETQAVASMLLDANTGATQWDMPFIANFYGHWTFGVDVLEKDATDELILLCQETETHESFVAQLDNGGNIMAGYHYYLGSNINNVGRDLEWIQPDDVFAIGGYYNAGTDYKAYLMDVDANLAAGFTIFNVEHLNHALYNYGNACTNPVFQPYMALGAIRPFIYNSEFFTYNTGYNHLFLETGEDASAVGSVIRTKLWRTPSVGTASDCTTPIPFTDTQLFYTYVNPMDPIGVPDQVPNVNAPDVGQNYQYDLTCGDIFGKYAAEVEPAFIAELVEDGIVLENDGTNMDISVMVTDVTGRLIKNHRIQFEYDDFISLRDLKENTIYFIEISNLTTGESRTVKAVM